MKKIFLNYSLIFVVFLLFHENSYSQAEKIITVNENMFGAIEARHIGPATMSGRIAAIDALHADPRIIYVGSASGGVWKSKNGGVHFEPVFDKYNQSIGAVTIDQNNPDTVWVGTGETWVRNSVSVGDGIYKTTDGGENWNKMGLENTERIGRIIVHPDDPDIIFVAALGHLWNSNNERGVYKSIDGGKNWNRILFVDENTGCSELAIDPDNPDILYAGMWDFRRYPHFFRSGGPGSGLYITRNGGDNWKKAELDIADDTLGRIAVEVSSVSSNIVYALVESKKSALYRSDDKGNNWTRVNETPAMGARPFYFSMIVSDPIDTNRISKPGYSLIVSENGGKNFRGAFVKGGRVHSDLHPLWICKNDNNLMYMGTDGGLYVSNDKASSWRFIRNLPVSQFYHVAVDDQIPYNVYGGLQDNGSWTAPSKSPSGIQNRNWTSIGGGDGFNVFPDKTDNNIIYWQWQGGNLRKKFMDTGESKDIKPYANTGEDDLRFNWNTPVVFSPTRNILYAGAQYLFRSGNKGDSWERISPDLTTNDPNKQLQEKTGGITIDNSTAENHCTIWTINESSANHDIIWVGTDDGNLQITKDGGQNWTNVISNVPDLPENTWVSYVCPSQYDEALAYVTFDGHRTGDKSVYVYQTTDYGNSWESIADENIKGYCYKIIEDSKNANLLFLGTEFGLFVSIDGGKIWSQFKGNIPNVSVRDIELQEKENDLVIGTHGRGVMIIDDITPLRQLSDDVLQQDVVFLDSRPFKLGYLGWEMGLTGDDEFVGENPPGASLITYYLRKRHVFGDMYIEIYNDKGEKLKELAAGKRKGINRVQWQMRMKGPRVPRSPLLAPQALYGPTYPPGEYRIKIVKGKETFDGKIMVEYDPAIPHTIADRNKRYEVLMKAYHLLEDLAYTDNRITEIQDQAEKKAELTNNETLEQKLILLANKMSLMHKELVATNVSGAITGEKKLRENIAATYSSINGYQGRPTKTQEDRIGDLFEQVKQKEGIIDKMVESAIPELNHQLSEEEIGPFLITSKEDFLKDE